VKNVQRGQQKDFSRSVAALWTIAMLLFNAAKVASLLPRVHINESPSAA
jgi:hypothetical protein